MDRRAAERIVPMLMKAAQELAATVDVFREYASDAQIESYATAVGTTVLAINGLLRPIVNEYPDLHP